MSAVVLAATAVKGPHIDWMAIAPMVALLAGACIVLMAGLVQAPSVRQTLVPLLTIAAAATSAGFAIANWGDNVSVIAGAMAMDDLTLYLTLLFDAAAICAVLLSWRALAPREAGHGEFHALLLSAVLGMVVLVGATDLVTIFIGYELLSIPLYVLCATTYVTSAGDAHERTCAEAAEAAEPNG